MFVSQAENFSFFSLTVLTIVILTKKVVPKIDTAEFSRSVSLRDQEAANCAVFNS